MRSSAFWYPGENAREIWLRAILRDMRTRRVCVTAQSKSSYCIIAGQKLSLRYCKNQAVGRNLSLPYIPLSLRSTLSQNTVCVFQNSQFEIALVSLWPLTIPVFEYPSAELSFSLSWKIILSKLQVTRSSPVAFAGFQHLRRILWPGSRQREDKQTDFEPNNHSFQIIPCLAFRL